MMKFGWNKFIQAWRPHWSIFCRLYHKINNHIWVISPSGSVSKSDAAKDHKIASEYTASFYKLQNNMQCLILLTCYMYNYLTVFSPLLNEGINWLLNGLSIICNIWSILITLTVHPVVLRCIFSFPLEVEWLPFRKGVLNEI